MDANQFCGVKTIFDPTTTIPISANRPRRLLKRPMTERTDVSVSETGRGIKKSNPRSMTVSTPITVSATMLARPEFSEAKT